MREKWARWIVFFTGLIVLLLSFVFALVQNPPNQTDMILTTTLETTESVVQNKTQINRGRLIYQQQACASCHSIAGQGNPRFSLDGIGIKHNAEALRDWITGGDTLKGSLPESVKSLKQTYRELPDDDLNDLIMYLQSLDK